MLRGALWAAEPFYTAAVTARNRFYDRGWLRTKRLPRPVISIGHLTTGGTGKTPMVRWLAEMFRNRGMNVAILSRGYKSTAGSLGDEWEMLRGHLNEGSSTPVAFCANSDRFAGGLHVLREHPRVDLFILDDGFQHRRLARDFDLVLMSAVAPFGFGHVLPRGLLREPMNGLRRASAVVITHADQVTPDALTAIQERVRQVNTSLPVYRAAHVQSGLRQSDQDSAPISALSGRRVLAFCGIGDPQTFERQLRSAGAEVVGSRFFPDHYAYRDADAVELQGEAASRGAEALVTTEKDWVKFSRLPRTGTIVPVWRVDVRIQFLGDDERLLLEQVSPLFQSRSAPQ
jgi:tetraacyldisaccharide 4'-kinase